MRIATTSRLIAAIATTVLCSSAAAGGVASASTWTVDDDRADCPNATFTSVQAAVTQAAPHDTVIICPGLYLEQSVPTSGNNTPSQTGSRNGVTITKPLTIRGAGADKVTIRPAAALGASLAGTAPYLRDGGGNVITVSRQAGGSSDFDENFLDISGVTVDSPNAYVEAGIAFFNTSGRVANSVVGPMLAPDDAADAAANPHGWGVVMSNHLQGAEAGVRRTVTVERSLVTGYRTGGILFDDARGADGTPTTLTRSGIVAYGEVVGSRVVGAGAAAVLPQTGIRYHAGHRGKVVDSEVVDNFWAADPRLSVGLLLTDAETGVDPGNPPARGFHAINNRFKGNGYALFNANISNDAVRLGAPAQATPGALGLENWWGCAAGPVVGGPSAGSTSTSCQGISGLDTGGAASVERGANRTVEHLTPTAPGPTVDTAPSGSFAEPVDGGVAVAGVDASPVVSVRDDFGVKSVAYAVDGVAVETDTEAPYGFAWTPPLSQLGDVVELTAVVTDSAGQTTTVSADVEVVAPAGYAALTLSHGAFDAGPVLVGASAARTFTATNTGAHPVTLGAVGVDGGGFELAPDATCATGAVLAVGETCAVLVRFTPVVAGSVDGTLSVAYTAPGGGGPLTADLAGVGVAPPAPPTPPAVVDPPAPPAADPPAAEVPAVEPPAAPVTVPSVVVTPVQVAFGAARTTTITRAGSVRVRIGCPASAGRTCRGTVTLRAVLSGRTPTTVGTARFALRPGSTTTLLVKLSARAQAKLESAGRLAMTVRVAGDGVTGTRTITVREG